MAVVVAPSRKVPSGPRDPSRQPLHGGGIARQVSLVGQGDLPDSHPGVQHPGVLEGVRHEAQSGGVTEAEESPPLLVEGHRRLPTLHSGTVLDHVVTEFPEQPGGHELGPVGRPEGMVGWVAGEGPHTKLAVGVEGGTPEDVTGVAYQVRIGLLAGGQGVNQVAEEPDAAVSSSQAQDPGVQASSLLFWHLHPQRGHQFLCDLTLHQDPGHFPPFGDDPVGVGRLIDGRSEGHETEPMAIGFNRVDGLAPTFGV